jgi:hypothetical protein
MRKYTTAWKLDCHNYSSKDDQDGSGHRITGRGTASPRYGKAKADGRYNVAPRQRSPVVRRDPEDGRAMIEEM